MATNVAISIWHLDKSQESCGRPRQETKTRKLSAFMINQKTQRCIVSQRGVHN